MKTLIFILIILSFLQTTVLPVNFLLIILICRNFIKGGKENFYLAFAFGFLISLLNLLPLGIISVVYLMLAMITQLVSMSRFTRSSILIVPLVAFALVVHDFTVNIITNQHFVLTPTLLWELFSILPVFYLVRLWEERFIIRKGIKLKFRS